MTKKPSKRSSTPPGELGHRWYFREWATHKGKIQSDADRELGWPRGKTSELWHGRQRYTQETIDEAARWLEIEPYELLMLPDEALRLRQIREVAQAIVANSPSKVTEPPDLSGDSTPRRKAS